MKEYSKEIKKLIKKQQINELVGYHMYIKMSEIINDDHNSRILRQIADEEMNHYEILTAYQTEEVVISKSRIKRIRFFVSLLTKLFGVTFVLKYFENSEASSSDLRTLYEKAPEVASFLEEEEQHEERLIEMLDEERLKYMGSVVLGLNDALVELTGALAGFTFSLQNSRTIALIGLITGISASFSMAASEFLSTKEEDTEMDAKKASIYTGIAYVITVILLILPFILISNYLISMAVTMGVAVSIIALFNYYITVAKGGNFRRKFLEMAAISIGVSLISFGIGFLVKTFIGIEV